MSLRPDQTRPDQTRPDQTRPDQTRPDYNILWRVYKMNELRTVYNHQKSFYNKARFFFANGNIYLMSHSYVVCFIDKDRKLHRTWWGYSKTTMLHVNEFVKQFINPSMFVSTSDWRNMEVE